MGKATRLTDIERGKILKLRGQNFSQRAIAYEIGRSKTVVANFLKDPDIYGSKKSTGRPKKISPALSRRILREVRRNSSQSSNQIKERTNAECSSRTIRRYLRAELDKKINRSHQLHLVPCHKTLRLELNKNQRLCEGAFIAFSYMATAEPSVAMERTTAVHYFDMLKRASFINERNSLHGTDWIFQMDVSATSTVYILKRFFHGNNYFILFHSPCSPDLIFIKNLWKWMTRDGYKNRKVLNSGNALHQAVFTSWHNILDNLESSILLQRIVDVITKNGAATF